MCLFIASLPNLQWSCAVVELKFIPLHVLRHRCDMLHHQCNMCYLFFIFQIFHPCPIWYVFLIPISLFTAWQICLPKCIIIHWWQANKRSQVVIVNGYSPSMDFNSVFYNIACYDQVRGCCVPNSQNYKLFTTDVVLYKLLIICQYINHWKWLCLLMASVPMPNLQWSCAVVKL